MSKPFSLQSVKVPLFNMPGAYEDLHGRPLDLTNFETWESVISSAKAAGANDVMLIVSTGVMRNYNDNRFDPTLSYNPDVESIRKLADLIKSKGMTVSINTFAHVANVISGSVELQGKDRPYPVDKNLWMQSFSKSILEWAAFSQKIDARAFIPFEDVTQHLVRDPELTNSWLELIKDIRSVYSGVLSTVWWSQGSGDSITSIPAAIIAGLDYLGIGFFPELSKDTNATVDQLVNAYYSDIHGNNVVQFLKDLSAKYNKPVWISDKAFHSFDGAASDEGRIFDSSIPLTPDFEEQARLYESFLRVFTLEGGGWLDGVAFQSFNNVRDTSNFLARFVNGPLSESPQGKPAMQVLTDWFQGKKQSEGLNLNLSTNFNDLVLQGGYHHDTITGGAGNNFLAGHAGNDTLIAGTAESAPISLLKVDIDVRGVKSQGASPVVSLRDSDGRLIKTQEVTAPLQLIDGQPDDAGSPTRITFYVDPAKSQFSLNLDNWGFFDFGPTGNRFVRVESIAINDLPLPLVDALLYVPPGDRPEQAGARDSVHGGKFVITPPSGVTPLAVFYPDNDQLVGGPGNDTLDGGSGLDFAVYNSNRSNFKIEKIADKFRITDLTGAEGTDTLIRIERLNFADVSVAIDFTGNAGTVAKILGAVVGKESLLNKEYVGIGLDLLDKGMSYSDLAAAALEAVGLNTNDKIVTALWTNVIGSAPSVADKAPFIQMLDNGFSRGELAKLAADTPENAVNIGLVGLAQTGLDYLPVG
jgi:hypothetical protein